MGTIILRTNCGAGNHIAHNTGQNHPDYQENRQYRQVCIISLSSCVHFG